MLAEMKESAPALNIEFIGINRSDQEASNRLVTSERSLPWVQDSPNINQWASWNAVWRDVRIVNSKSELVGVYNLTLNNLSVEENRSTLSRMIMEHAVVLDADADGLRDDWESVYLEELASLSGSEDDPDQDGYSNYAEYAFGSHPRSASSIPWQFPTSVTRSDGVVLPAVLLRRRAGADVSYHVQESTDLQGWSDEDTAMTWIPLKPSYDGTGTFMALCASQTSMKARSATFFRVVADR